MFPVLPASAQRLPFALFGIGMLNAEDASKADIDALRQALAKYEIPTLPSAICICRRSAVFTTMVRRWKGISTIRRARWAFTSSI